VVVEDGVAIGLEQVVHDRPVAGDHEYVLAPDAVTTVELPAHTDVLVGDTVTVGLLVTVTVTVLVDEQDVELFVPVTVYVVVVLGDAVGEAQVVQLKPVAGLQL
jgi:hypothetical protein